MNRPTGIVVYVPKLHLRAGGTWPNDWLGTEAGRATGRARMKRFDVTAAWDSESGVWWGTNDELPLTTEAPTIEGLELRAAEIAQEIAEMNGHVTPGEHVQIRIIVPPSTVTP